MSLYGMGGDFLSPHWIEPHIDGVRFNGPFTHLRDVAHLLNEPQAQIAYAPINFISEDCTNDLNFRGSLYNFWQCHGTFLDNLTGIDGLTAKLRRLPYAEREAAIPTECRDLFPQLRVDDLPPTVLVHGAEDTSVDVSDSDKTYAALTKKGTRAKYYRVEGLEHGLMSFPEKRRGHRALEAFDRAFAFCEEEMNFGAVTARHPNRIAEDEIG